MLILILVHAPGFVKKSVLSNIKLGTSFKKMLDMEKFIVLNNANGCIIISFLMFISMISSLFQHAIL